MKYGEKKNIENLSGFGAVQRRTYLYASCECKMLQTNTKPTYTEAHINESIIKGIGFEFTAIAKAFI